MGPVPVRRPAADQPPLFPEWFVDEPAVLADARRLAPRLNEYQTVARHLTDPLALWRAAAVPLNRSAAADLIDAALASRSIPYEVHFGRARRSSYGGLRLRPQRRGYISLCDDGLTAATVLHEVAHVIGMWNGSARGHDRAFTAILDELLAGPQARPPPTSFPPTDNRPGRRP